MTPEFSARTFDFFARVDQTDPGFCHPWTGATTASGRGFITFRSENWDVRDVAFSLWNGGPMPPSRFATRGPTDWHAITICGNRLCCAPRHLLFREGARPDTRGRRRALTRRQAALCRTRAHSQADYAEAFGTTVPTVQAAQRRTGAYAEDAPYLGTPHFTKDELGRIQQRRDTIQQRPSTKAVKQQPSNAAAIAAFLHQNGFAYPHAATILRCHPDTVRARVRRAKPEAVAAMKWETLPGDTRERAERMRAGQALLD